MSTDQSLQIAATLLGPLLAAEATKATPAEAARRLFELANAIQHEAKQQPVAPSTVQPLRM